MDCIGFRGVDSVVFSTMSRSFRGSVCLGAKSEGKKGKMGKKEKKKWSGGDAETVLPTVDICLFVCFAASSNLVRISVFLKYIIQAPVSRAQILVLSSPT